MQENLQQWLTDEKSRDQFVIRAGSDTAVLSNDATQLKAEPVYKRAVSRIYIYIYIYLNLNILILSHNTVDYVLLGGYLSLSCDSLILKLSVAYFYLQQLMNICSLLEHY